MKWLISTMDCPWTVSQNTFWNYSLIAGQFTWNTPLSLSSVSVLSAARHFLVCLTICLSLSLFGLRPSLYTADYLWIDRSIARQRKGMALVFFPMNLCKALLITFCAEVASYSRWCIFIMQDLKVNNIKPASQNSCLGRALRRGPSSSIGWDYAQRFYRSFRIKICC